MAIVLMAPGCEAFERFGLDAAGRRDAFATIVATHLHNISSELERASLAAPALAEPTAAPDRSGSPVPASRSSATLAVPPLLSVACAERLASGSLVFPAATGGNGWSGEPAWHVFSHRQAEPPGGGALSGQVLFAQVGVIGGALGDDAFVALAYQVILERPPDPEGHAAYRQTLQSGHQSRHGVLRDLAGSAEAGASERLLVILPGDWLPVSEAMSEFGEGLPDAVRVELRELSAKVGDLPADTPKAAVDGGMAEPQPA